MVQLLLAHFCPSDTNALLRFLPSEQGKKIVGANISQPRLEAAFITPLEKIKNIHPSWLSEWKEKKSGWIRMIIEDFFKGRIEGSSPRGAFLQTIAQELEETFFPCNILPEAYLPPSELQPLVTLSKEEILQLIDFLGICDLAAELQHIVDRKLIQKAYQSISAIEQAYLRERISKKEHTSPARLHLEKWNQESATLKKILHQRGIIRFATALGDESHQLIWYIIHHIDRKRGTFIQEQLSSPELKLLQVPVQKKIILHALNFLMQKGVSK